MEKQIWFCERCGRNGPIQDTPGDGAYAVIERIGEAHRLKSPQCISGTTDLRILTLEES
jgi:hypothetical protein